MNSSRKYSLLLAAGFCMLPWPAMAQSSSTLDGVTSQVAAAGAHSCALTTEGTVKCWGANSNGQLGNNNNNTDSATPVFVTGTSGTGKLGSVVAITTNANHSCALTTAGAVMCWGDNSFGELGNGTTTDSSIPVPVTGLGSGVAAITAGDSHNCALTTAGAVKCWGYNSNGQLGDGTSTDSPIPVAVTGLGSGVAAITAGYVHSCALSTDGAVMCWGGNGKGQLGDGTTADRHTPGFVTDSGGAGHLSSVAAITAGYNHTCALTTLGTAKCWGNNLTGQLGDGTTAESSIPVPVTGLGSDVAAITAGYYYTCALSTAGAVLCWGYNSAGQLGNGTTTNSLTPGTVSGLGGGVAAVTAGSGHSCALTKIGVVVCWGSNASGQLGNGTNTSSSIPVVVTGLSSGVATVAAGLVHSCALTTAGAVMCWGMNDHGQLGDGTTTDRHTPVAVTGLGSGVVAITAGTYHSCALTTAGAVKCWGDNTFGQLGDGTTADSSIPVPVTGLGSGVAAITAGDSHNCTLTTTGAVKCWGYNGTGQLGDGTTTDRHTPVAVTGLGSGVVAITAGYFHSCALTTTGAVKCWGYNNYGQLGDGTTTERHTPDFVTDSGGTGQLSSIAAITAGYNHNCALTTLGTAMCWGYNNKGQLGDGTTTDRHTPVTVTGLGSGVAAITGGYSHSCALSTAGAVLCWGYNNKGQLGDGTTTDRHTPVAVTGLGSGAAAITAGASHSCAVTTAWAVKCWGADFYGQLGDGTNMERYTPVVIRASQSITFHPPTTLSVGASLALGAAASSGNTVSFDTWTPDTCTVSGNTLTVTALSDGLCGVRASQAGGTRPAGGSDAPAPQQLRLIRISDFIFRDGFDDSNEQ